MAEKVAIRFEPEDNGDRIEITTVVAFNLNGWSSQASNLTPYQKLILKLLVALI